MTRSITALAIAAILALSASAEIIDRIAAIVDDEPVTTSEIDQLLLVRFFEQRPDETTEEYRRRTLSNMIAQMLRFRDVQRFGAIDVSVQEVEAKIDDIRSRFPSEEAFQEALQIAEISLEQLRAIAKRQIQVEAYINERFSPMIFVSLEEIERYYRDVWVEERLERELPLLPLSAVREEIRNRLKSEQLEQEIDRWTAELRERASVDVYL